MGGAGAPTAPRCGPPPSARQRPRHPGVCVGRPVTAALAMVAGVEVTSGTTRSLGTRARRAEGQRGLTPVCGLWPSRARGSWDAGCYLTARGPAEHPFPVTRSLCYVPGNRRKTVAGSGARAGAGMVETRVQGPWGQSLPLTTGCAAPRLGRRTEVPATWTPSRGQVWGKGRHRGVHAPPRFPALWASERTGVRMRGGGGAPHLVSPHLPDGTRPAPAHSAPGLSVGSLPPQA